MQRFEKAFEKPLLRRSFFYYIQQLREMGAPLESRTEKQDFGRVTYYYYDDSFSISGSLNRLDVLKIQSALNVLQQFEHLPQMQDLEEVLLKLEQQVQASSLTPTLLFEHRPASSGVHWLRILHNHITRQEVVKIHYQPFPFDEKDLLRCTGVQVELIFHPYFLKESKNLWYIFGCNHQSHKIENYALDRISHIEHLPTIFYKPHDKIEPSRYFDDIIGVTLFPDKALETFIIKVNNIMAPYWLNRPLHHSQTVLEQTPQYVLFSFQLRWNYEWQNLILSYGFHVEVLEPLHFRESIQDILKQALKHYK